MSEELLAIADELYALPLAEFTPVRDARARELKGSDLAAPVKELRKPSLAAWVVNLLVRRDADQVAQVLDLGVALREAAAGMQGEELRALTRQRRQLTAAVTTGARALASSAGVKVTQAVADQVEATLTAAMVDPSCAEAVRTGLLVRALSATGLGAGEEDDLAGALAVPEAAGWSARPVEPDDPAPPDLRVVPDPDADEKARAAARERVEAARAVLEQARESLQQAAAEVAELEARGMQLQAEADELRGRLADLEEQREQVEEELGDAEDVRSEAEAALASADRDHAEAGRALEALGGTR